MISPTFYFKVPWRKATSIRRELARIPEEIPHRLSSFSTGEIAFMFPDLPVHQYVRVIRIFGSNGIELMISENEQII
ncbi:hypothetical protein NDK47_00150 [Brevibacillus ruminantium]|uniref:Uncharacterized protein n=1 Tax=Brevibacillus ruminantium TaxID=2950604 RepID=A0ABY4WJ10_9BACL|nr:hypothetical protein [Brevibacillus ruminantium]USG65830.1 hypothetical protein NDK47_00150 [Brevibacillus ruminantium]